VLKDNQLGNKGIAVVTAIVKQRTCLTRLDISNCGFNMTGGEALLGQLAKNTNILEVVLDFNDLASRF